MLGLASFADVPVFEERLRKDTSDGSDLSGMMIKFVLAAQAPEGGTADQLQATAAVDQATEAIGTLSSTPAASTTAFTEVQIFETTWSVLLKRLELFNRL